MEKIDYKVYSRSGQRFEFKFTKNDYSFSIFGYERQQLMPSSITLVVPPECSGSHWAILQAFQENEEGQNNKLLMDNISSAGHKCSSNYKFKKQPPFCSSYLDGSFFDRPTYDCSYDGNIIFYTLLTEMEGDASRDRDSFFRCRYYCSAGFIWGLEEKESKVVSLPVIKMENSKIDEILEVFRASYPNASFACC